MDYTLNASLFICVLRDYLALGAPDNLLRLFTGDSCQEYLHTTRLLLNSLRILLLLEARKAALVLLTPLADLSGFNAQEAIIVSYCLSLMDEQLMADLPYGLSVAVFDQCGAPQMIRKVRGANSHASLSNDNFLSTSPVLTPNP